MSPPDHAILSAIRAAIPSGIAFAGGPIGPATASPYPQENAAIVHAVDKRRREFIAGRTYARHALAQLGAAAAPIPVLPSRAPAWPSGFTGSLSHSDTVCAAVVAPSHAFAGIGLDIESSSALAENLRSTVAHASELTDTTTPPGRVDRAKRLFVAKEAFFKLYHPLAGHFLDFLDVDVALDDASRDFRLQLRPNVPALLGRRSFTGLCGDAGDHCFALLVLPHD